MQLGERLLLSGLETAVKGRGREDGAVAVCPLAKAVIRKERRDFV